VKCSVSAIALGCFRAGIVFCLFVSFAPSATGSDTSERWAYLNGGYHLLYQVCDDESNVSMIFLVKDAPVKIEVYAKHVSKTADESLVILEHMQDREPQLKFDRNPLPAVERDVRASIRSDKEDQLVFDTSGPDFVRAFLVSQIEASSYASNLAKVLEDRETDPRRIQALREVSAKWKAIRQDSFRLLRD